MAAKQRTNGRAPRLLPLATTLVTAAVAVLGLGLRSGAAAATLAPVSTSIVTHQAANSTSISSPSFSTSQPNTVLVALLGSGGPVTSGQHYQSVKGGGLAWTLGSLGNAELGDTEIWYAVAPSPLTNVNVSATRVQSAYAGFIQVLPIQGADVTHPIGAVAAAASLSGGPQVSLTPTRAGSLILASGNDWDYAVPRTVSPGQTLLDQFVASATQDTFWTQSMTAATAGKPVTMSDSAPTVDRWNMAAVEVLPAVASPTPTPSPTPSPTAPGQTVLFDDEFNASSLNSSLVVLNRDGDQSNSELECYTPSNVSLGSGVLDIRTQSGYCPPPNNYPYTSGMVQWDTFQYTYGTLEARMKMPGGQGTWPGLWLLGSNCQLSNHTTADNVLGCDWHHTGSQEIDIAEKLCGNNCMNEELWADTGNTGCRPSTLSDVTTNWHTYTLEWKPGSLIWKIDGVETCSATQGVPASPMFLIINTAVGGAGGGTVDPSTLPQDFQIDYVRVTSP